MDTILDLPWPGDRLLDSDKRSPEELRPTLVAKESTRRLPSVVQEGALCRCQLASCAI